jgi:hypothetical protein
MDYSIAIDSLLYRRRKAVQQQEAERATTMFQVERPHTLES